MRRYRQTTEEILESLSRIKTTWKDEHAATVIGLLKGIPEREEYSVDAIAALLEQDFDAGITTIRLLLELSRDEFSIEFRELLGEGGIGITRFRSDRAAFLSTLDEMGVMDSLEALVNADLSWRDILIERLKTGRGSAIKGQKRGRFLEDRTEAVVDAVYSAVGYDVRCRFDGASGLSTEKADFAIPSRTDPRILIEVKAYGATGSKQTDVLGDIFRVVDEKRHDTNLLLVTDGISWKRRVNDLRRLVDMQNQGHITRIYTSSMFPDLEEDLIQLRSDHSL